MPHLTHTRWAVLVNDRQMLSKNVPSIMMSVNLHVQWSR